MSAVSQDARPLSRQSPRAARGPASAVAARVLRGGRVLTATFAYLFAVYSFIQPVGYPGPSSQAAYDALNNHVVTDMFSAYCTGKSSADAAIADATKRLKDSLAKFPV